MRSSIMVVAIALAIGSTSFSASAQSSSTPSRDAEIAELKAMLAVLQAKVASLEERTDAQSDINVGTQESIQSLADSSPKVETKGGIKVTSPDQKFQASVGGRIHFDAYAFDRDLASTTGTTEFRRARLTLSGTVYDWQYKLEQDFAVGSTTEGFKDVYIATDALGGKVTIGHFKPYRSLDELTSSNETSMMERPFASASGLYNGRQFVQGVGYLRGGDNYSLGGTVHNLRNAASPRNEGVGVSARATFAPINRTETTVHLGLSASSENTNRGSENLSARVNYAGRRGPSQTIATTTGASGDSVDSIGLEAAAAFGPLFVQSEYATATFHAPQGREQDVETFYVMGSWMLTGEHKPYKAASGVFGSPKGDGMWELTARYDTIENKDVANLDVASTTLGVNYYFNPNVRMMFNYTRGDNELTGDETGQYALRTQLSF